MTLCSAGTSAEKNERALLHSYVERIPEEGLHYVNSLLRTMGEQAPRHGAALRELINTRLSRDPGGTADAAELRQVVDSGSQHFIEGEYSEAIAQLTLARERMLDQQSSMAVDQTLRALLHRATLFLAHAQLRSGNAAPAAMLVAEAIRSFPDRELSLVRHGPDLVRLYKQERRRLRQQRRGTLSVKTEPSGCMVFVNERYVGLSPAVMTELYPGNYRVFLQRPNQPGRVHTVRVPNGRHELTVDFQLDRALQTTPEALLLYADAATQRRLAHRHAAQIGRQIEAREMLLVGLRRYQGRRSLQGTLIASDTGRVVRTGLIALEPETPTPDQIKDLGQFLLLGQQRAGVTVLGTTSSPAEQSSGLWRWVTLGVGIAALGAGVPLLVLHESGTCTGPNCPKTHNTGGPGLALTIGGAAVLAGSAVLFVLHALPAKQADTSASTVLLPWLDRRSAGLMAASAF